jgi:hypothetical protein
MSLLNGKGRDEDGGWNCGGQIQITDHSATNVHADVSARRIGIVMAGRQLDRIFEEAASAHEPL